ncbi:MAG TPA: hypothetical protein PLK80_17745 [bacterium]|nr:hypothetical protein [bacterium]HPN94386.1 hypothetical protein [bacterium]
MTSNSPGSIAGAIQGDIIIKADRKEVEKPSELRDIIKDISRAANATNQSRFCSSSSAEATTGSS